MSIQLLSPPQVEESAVFQRDGFDIYSNVKISFTQAILGGEARIPGLNGHIMVKARNSRKTNVHKHLNSSPRTESSSAAIVTPCYSYWKRR